MNAGGNLLGILVHTSLSTYARCQRKSFGTAPSIALYQMVAPSEFYCNTCLSTVLGLSPPHHLDLACGPGRTFSTTQNLWQCLGFPDVVYRELHSELSLLCFQPLPSPSRKTHLPGRPTV
ncbi:hypothetical protein K431DRAFT_45036 [Polychaeton citri CBS 116435]|uniref:Uncharacterized protein n=1 Tax=Polychaeton citri CBS 116435 TaxID=1314669 RepID=A0A9P4UNM3_9PEZI|nr:hypothetical protein K431DRAFT_45036 [Polychaeton citri CBS 116435]